jgi:hypothetical protein
MHEEKQKVYRVLMGKLEGKYCLGVPGRRRKDAQVDLKEVEWIGVDWIHLAPDRDK